MTLKSALTSGQFKTVSKLGTLIERKFARKGAEVSPLLAKYIFACAQFSSHEHDHVRLTRVVRCALSPTRYAFLTVWITGFRV